MSTERPMSFVESLSSYATGYSRPGGYSILSLAGAGFCYSVNKGKIMCPICRLEIESQCMSYGQLTDLMKVHTSNSPDCQQALMCSQQNEADFMIVEQLITLMKNVCQVSDTGHVPVNRDERNSLDAPGLAQIKGLPSDDEMLTVLHIMKSRRELNNACNQSAPPPSLSTVEFDRKNPDFARLKGESMRLSMFHDWSPSFLARPSELAADGWFYTGENDCVQCAFCLGKLHRWTRKDTPSSEHRIHFPNCPFVNGCYVGNVPLTADDVTMAAEDADFGKRQRKEDRGNDVEFGPASCVEQEPDDADAEDGEHLLEENRKLIEATTCMKCRESERDTVFIPCGHLVTCHNCACRMKKCSTCNKDITNSYMISRDDGN